MMDVQTGEPEFFEKKVEFQGQPASIAWVQIPVTPPPLEAWSKFFEAPTGNIDHRPAGVGMQVKSGAIEFRDPRSLPGNDEDSLAKVLANVEKRRQYANKRPSAP